MVLQIGKAVSIVVLNKFGFESRFNRWDSPQKTFI